jgi:predicted Zn-ribbon and HTH transcriptional regulator
MSALPALKPRVCPHPKCGHEWYPRKKNPTMCPECKRNLPTRKQKEPAQ